MNDKILLDSILNKIVVEIGLTKVTEAVHSFVPQGHSIVYVLKESHIAIHSWPEYEYAYITISSCSEITLDLQQYESIISSVMTTSNIQLKTIDSQVCDVAR